MSQWLGPDSASQKMVRCLWGFTFTLPANIQHIAFLSNLNTPYQFPNFTWKGNSSAWRMHVASYSYTPQQQFLNFVTGNRRILSLTPIWSSKLCLPIHLLQDWSLCSTNILSNDIFLSQLFPHSELNIKPLKSNIISFFDHELFHSSIFIVIKICHFMPFFNWQKEEETLCV